MQQTEQQFLKNLDKELWTAANKLLPMLDAAVYKHVVLGLIFLKYVSDSFTTRRVELWKAFRDPQNEYRESAAQGEKLGLNESEFFYEALANNESDCRELGD